jgi:hypothetical protein
MEPEADFVTVIISPCASFCMLGVPLRIFELHRESSGASKQIKLDGGFCCDDVGAWQ